MFQRRVEGIGRQQILQAYLIRVLHSHDILCPTDIIQRVVPTLCQPEVWQHLASEFFPQLHVSLSFRVAKAFKRRERRTFLVVQWLRLQLPMQGTWVGPLVQEEPTCHGNQAHVPRSPCSATREAIAMRSPVHHAWKVAPAHCSWRKPTNGSKNPVQFKKKKKVIFFFFFKKRAYLL